jgi:hypothetical protein
LREFRAAFLVIDRTCAGSSSALALACMDQVVWAATIDEYRRVAAARLPTAREVASHADMLGGDRQLIFVGKHLGSAPSSKWLRALHTGSVFGLLRKVCRTRIATAIDRA